MGMSHEDGGYGQCCSDFFEFVCLFWGGGCLFVFAYLGFSTGDLSCAGRGDTCSYGVASTITVKSDAHFLCPMLML